MEKQTEAERIRYYKELLEIQNRIWYYRHVDSKENERALYFRIKVGEK